MNRTNIEQSKELAKILPLETADMCFCNDGTSIKIDATAYSVGVTMWKGDLYELIPCWSLAALLEIIRKPAACDLLINGRGYRCHCTDKSEGKFYGTDDYCNDAIDACIEVIIKLHKQNLL